MAREPINRKWNEQPDAPQQYAQPDNATWEDGWRGGAIEQPPKAGYQNWWQRRVDDALQDIERRGFMSYVATAEYEIGALALASDGFIYRSQVNGNIGNDPAFDAGINWIREPLGIATVAESQGWLNNLKVLTPGRLSDAFKGQNQNLAKNGRQNLPGGFQLRFGSTGNIDGDQNATVSFNTPFPNACLIVIPSIRNTVTGNDEVFPRIITYTASSVTVRAEVAAPNTTVTGTRQIEFIAIGY